VTHQFENGLIPYASYTEGFIQNFGKTINGNPLDPSKSKQWEAGLRYEFPSGDLMVSAAAFDLRKTNVRDYDLNDPTFSSFTQAGEVRSRGIELEARGRITENLQGVLAYTYLDTEITKASDPAKIGNENAMAPPHQFAAWLDYDVSDLVEGLSVGAGVRFNSSAYSTQYNLRETPSYAIADASLRYEVDQFEVYLGVTNLFDEEYYGVCYDSYGCTDGERRRISLSVSTRF
jgi:iron complex outermembrane receptor protein